MLPGGDWRIQGELVKELTYGHVVLLTRMDCLTPITAGDVSHFIGVCSRDYENGKEYIYKYPAHFKDEHESRTIEIEKNLSDWISGVDHYLESHCVTMESTKKVWAGQTKTPGKLGSPHLSLMRVQLIRMGYSPTEIFEAPYAHCLLDIQTLLEINGASAVTSDESLKAKEMIEELVKSGRLVPSNK